MTLIEGPAVISCRIFSQNWNRHQSVMLLVHRRNVRASIRNRPSFPKINHYEHYLIDQLEAVYMDLFKRHKYTWWPITSAYSVMEEPFGMVPTVPSHEQEKVTDDMVKDYPPSMQFIAKCTKTTIPYIGINGKQEKLLYLKSVPQYIGSSGLDDQKFTKDWNSGCLKQADGTNHSEVPAGTNQIWRKKAFHIRSYYKTYVKALERKRLVYLNANNDALLGNNDLDFLECAEPSDIPDPVSLVVPWQISTTRTDEEDAEWNLNVNFEQVCKHLYSPSSTARMYPSARHTSSRPQQHPATQTLSTSDRSQQQWITSLPLQSLLRKESARNASCAWQMAFPARTPENAPAVTRESRVVSTMIMKNKNQTSLEFSIHFQLSTLAITFFSLSFPFLPFPS